MVEGEPRPVMTRAGSMIAQQWRQFGIDAKTDVAQGTLVDRRAAGDFDTIIALERRDLGRPSRTCRSSSTAGIRSSSPQPGKPQTPRNWQRWSIARARQDHRADPHVGFDDPKSLELGREYVKLAVQRNADHPADGLQRLHRDG